MSWIFLTAASCQSICCQHVTAKFWHQLAVNQFAVTCWQQFNWQPLIAGCLLSPIDRWLYLIPWLPPAIYVTSKYTTEFVCRHGLVCGNNVLSFYWTSQIHCCDSFHFLTGDCTYFLDYLLLSSWTNCLLTWSGLWKWWTSFRLNFGNLSTSFCLWYGQVMALLSPYHLLLQAHDRTNRGLRVKRSYLNVLNNLIILPLWAQKN